MTDTIRIPVGPSGSPTAWTVIDLEDYERVNAFRWYVSGRGYPFAPKAIDGRSVFLHGFVLGRLNEDDKLHIDHINRDILDNRKANLRVVTHRENILNSERFDDRDERIAAVRQLRAAGSTVRDVAETVGLSSSTVVKWTSDFPRREIQGASGGTTYRAVEKGIYQRHYKSTGIVLPGLFVNDLRSRRFIRFETIDEARAFRATGEWRRIRKPRERREPTSHCRKGHLYDDHNTYVSPRGERQCRTCNRAAVERYAARKRLEVVAA